MKAIMIGFKSVFAVLLLLAINICCMKQDDSNRLKAGVETWNKWREQNINIKPDLVGTNFVRATLQGANFDRADLRNANFNRARLAGAFFERACLDSVWLDGADLQNADLRGTDLEEQSLLTPTLR